MMHNPLLSPLFVPMLLRVAGLLVAGLVLVAVAERRLLRRPRSIVQSTLFKRVLSWALMAPTFVLGVFVGGPVSLLVVLLLIVQGTREFAAVTGMHSRFRLVLLGLGPVAIVAAVVAPAAFFFLPVAVFLLVGAVAVARGEVAGSYRDVTITLFGFMYVPLMLSFFALIGHWYAHGAAVLLLVGMSVALADVCAYVAGNVFHGPRLLPKISPNKTLAGVAGSVVGAYAAMGIMLFAVPPTWPVPVILAMPMLLAIASVWGDLLESLIKRTFAVKDAGTLLPGFGGVLDRIDSLIVALPLAYAALRLAG
jgi:phosphatidate cytidylyltransferase